jgi:hypothetical protein
MTDIANSPIWLFGLAGMTALVLLGFIIVVLSILFKKRKR